MSYFDYFPIFYYLKELKILGVQKACEGKLGPTTKWKPGKKVNNQNLIFS